MLLSIIIPTKDQTEKTIRNLRDSGLAYHASLNIDHEFILVDDGSDEANHALMLEEMKTMPNNVRLAPFEPKKGKGHNVQKGILEAKGDYVMFMDADFATDLKTLEAMLPDLQKYDCQVASRHSKGSRILSPQTFKRRLVSWGSRLIIRMKFHFKGIHDTQCGYKLFRTDVAKEMAKRQIIDGFGFDCEYLYFLKLNGFSFREVPCDWTDDADSTIHNARKTAFKVLKELKEIKKNRKNYILDEETLKRLKGENHAD